MRIDFTKMHGLGNDFVMLDARDRALPPFTNTMIAALADRRTGIGCDQIIMLEPHAKTDTEADFRMRIFNADGGEVEACGNAARAVALLHGEPAKVATCGGVITLTPSTDGATVDMGEPRFDWQKIPLAYAMDSAAMPVSWPGMGKELEAPFAINVGNPHVVFFVAECGDVDLAALGPVIENDELFPDRINVNVASLRDGEVDLRVWERGTGLTRACGTGACATAVAAISRGLASSPVTVNLPGGALEIAWEHGGSILMSGPAAESYRGSFEWNDFA